MKWDKGKVRYIFKKIEPSFLQAKVGLRLMGLTSGKWKRRVGMFAAIIYL